MAENISKQQLEIRVGTHGEDYGSWMSNPVFYVFGGLVLLAAVLAVLSFTTFHLTVLGVLLAVVTAALLIMLIWMAWIRRQYAFGKGGMMERVHQFILSNLDFDGHGEVLEVGCGSGALIVRTALTWPEAKITGLDYWGAMYNYSKSVCEQNAASEGVGGRCTFVHGDANKLDFPDERFDAVISRNLTWNLPHPDRAYAEWTRVLKKGGVLLNFDANWYAYLFDEDAQAAWDRDRRSSAERGVWDQNVEAEGEHFDVMEEIARRVPLSKIARPAWDLQQLASLGLKAEADETVWKRVWSEEETISFASTPMFLVRGRK